mmetsp:Transcript_52437/g.83247  ORF Transcript_52437/g.83247 Transcript_52437/m.83247 type:complete len:225 (-) Transcript_52437:1091-1765(-)
MVFLAEGCGGKIPNSVALAVRIWRNILVHLHKSIIVEILQDVQSQLHSFFAFRCHLDCLLVVGLLFRTQFSCLEEGFLQSSYGLIKRVDLFLEAFLLGVKNCESSHCHLDVCLCFVAIANCFGHCCIAHAFLFGLSRSIILQLLDKILNQAPNFHKMVLRDLDSPRNCIQNSATASFCFSCKEAKSALHSDLFSGSLMLHTLDLHKRNRACLWSRSLEEYCTLL